MPNSIKSQWDFGELFPPEATRKVLSVSELTQTIRRLVEGKVGRIWVSGEITNLRLQASGHCYFTLKDPVSQLSCVLFRDEARATLRSELRDGQTVILQGEMTVYEARGQYQLRVSAIELQGIGALQAAFERLKQKLNAAGLFAPERKRPLPAYPQRIGIVTSPTGAAIRDVVHVVARRQPGLEMVLAPCRVQGQGAAGEIAAAIRLLNEWSATRSSSTDRGLDLILLTRGGGSLEDLWAFNEEVVAFAIFESRLPVVSAVGHEIDFTISDFVADFRAATPSAAAEILTEKAFASRQFVGDASVRLRTLIGRRLADEHYDLRQIIQRLRLLHPRRRIDDHVLRVDEICAGMVRSGRLACRARRVTLDNLLQRLLRLRPSAVVDARRLQLRQVWSLLAERARIRLTAAGARFSATADQLRLLSPQSALERGYSVTVDAATGAVIRDASSVKVGQRLMTRLKNGEISSVVSPAIDPPGGTTEDS